MGRKSVIVLATAAVISQLGLAVPASAALPAKAKGASATVSAPITGAPAGSRVLAVLSNGASSYGTISDGSFTVKLPKVVGATASFSLHLVTSEQTYAGPVSFGKAAGKKTKWYGRLAVRNGATTRLPTVTFTTDYGTMRLTGSAAKLSVAIPLKKVTATGKPAGAGRFGLGSRASATSASATEVSAAGGGADASPGDDLDADGVPNTLDIDDNGNGIPDPVDKTTGANGSSPTARYDAVASLGVNIDDGGTSNAINYNLFRAQYPSTDDLMKHVAQLTSSRLVMGIRAISNYFSKDAGSYVRAGWIDCAGLAWCLTADDATDPSDVVTAPAVTPLRWDTIYSLWTKAYGDHTESVTWASFTMKGLLLAARAAGDNRVTNAVLNRVADQPAGVTGFGLYDDNVLEAVPGPGGSKDSGTFGGDLWTFVLPGGGSKLLQNLQPGDVFTVNAIMNDGSTKSIAMTVAPYFVTAPTITTMEPTGRSLQTINYSDTHPIGGGQNPLLVAAAQPTVDLTFWRPQRQRIPGADTVAGDEPLVDMGHLDYSVQIQAEGFKAQCPNSSLTFTSSDGSGWRKLAATPNGPKKKTEFTNDLSDDAQAAVSRTVALRIDLKACFTANSLSVAAGTTRYMLTVMANGQLGNDSNRNGANQAMFFKFD